MVGSDGLHGLYHRDLRDFAPRIGFAWDALKDTVVRGGYGLYYDYVPQDILIANYTTSAGVATNPIGPQPVLPMNFDYTAFNGTNPVPNSPIMSAPNPGAYPAGGPYPVFVTPQTFRSPYTQNWNLNVQERLGLNASMELGYVGSKGTRLVRLTDWNEPDATGTNPNPNFYSIDALTTSSSSNYHSLQASMRIQNAHHVSGFAGYVWSKSLDYASDGIDFIPGAAFPQDPGNLAAERGPSTFDTRQRFTAALNYDLPEWHGAKSLGVGWQVNTIISIQSGRPIPIDNSFDNSGRFYFNQRPNVVPGVNPVLSNWNPVTGYLNPLAFSQPADGTFGNLGRNSIYGPGYRNWDFSITKNTRIAERLDLQLRVEFFNLLNHPNFALPNHNITAGYDQFGNLQCSPTQGCYDGVITQTPDVAQTNPGLGGGGPRVIQVGAKFLF